MKIKLHAGAELDMINADELRRELRSWSAELRAGARLVRRSLSGTVAADGTLALGLAEQVGPEQSMVWGITRITVAGANARPSTYVEAANPGAGNNLTVTVPAGQIWTLRMLNVILTTSAVVGNRIVELFADDGADVWFRTSINASIAASSTRPASFWPGGPNNGFGSIAAPLPNGGLVVPGGHRFRTSVVNFDAADTLTGLSYWYDTSTGGAVPLGAYANAPDPGSLLAALNPGTQTFDGRAVVLQAGERLVIAGTGLTPGEQVTVTAQIREVPAQLAWSL